VSKNITLVDLAKQNPLSAEIAKIMMESNTNPVFRAIMDNFPADYKEVKVAEDSKEDSCGYCGDNVAEKYKCFVCSAEYCGVCETLDDECPSCKEQEAGSTHD